jgi:hypothetical protein
LSLIEPRIDLGLGELYFLVQRCVVAGGILLILSD